MIRAVGLGRKPTGIIVMAGGWAQVSRLVFRARPLLRLQRRAPEICTSLVASTERGRGSTRRAIKMGQSSQARFLWLQSSGRPVGICCQYSTHLSPPTPSSPFDCLHLLPPGVPFRYRGRGGLQAQMLEVTRAGGSQTGCRRPINSPPPPPLLATPPR